MTGDLRPVLSLSNVCVEFLQNGKTLLVLQDFSLDVAPGELLTILGPSGCGKSTALNVMGEYLLPNSGTVEFDVPKSNQGMRKSCLMFQPDTIFPSMRVVDNISFAPRVSGMAKSDYAGTVKELMASVGLTEFRHFWPYQLSGGMRKRLELARAFASSSSILLLDEPFGQLDTQTREEMQCLLLRIRTNEHRTIVMVTHSAEEACFCGDRVAIMSDRPGTILNLVDLPFGSNRVPDLKLQPDFIEVRRRVEHMLRKSRRTGTA